MTARELLEKLSELPEKELDRIVIFEPSDMSCDYMVSEILVLKYFPGRLSHKDNQYLRLR